MGKFARVFLMPVLIGVFFTFSLTGCAALKKKLTRKPKVKPKAASYYQVKEYDIKPSMELYEKHYALWVHWHRELVAGLGKNLKRDLRSSRELIGNLRDMETLLVDDKALKLAPHIEELNTAKAIIEERTMTKAKETRIRRIVEREYRAIKREFSPNDMAEYIRKEWKK